jgi:hypothetical protein
MNRTRLLVVGLALPSFLALGLSGCGSLEVAQRNQVRGVVAVAAMARSPSTEIEQTYYLGVFDPQEQLPPLLYRVRVRGQASFLSNTQFASGWVPSGAIDSLKGMAQDASGQYTFQKSGDYEKALDEAGKRLFMFGPEGFRQAPQNHRLAIVMGSSPEAFFQGIDNALGTIASAKTPRSVQAVSLNVAKFLSELDDGIKQYEAIK